MGGQNSKQTTSKTATNATENTNVPSNAMRQRCRIFENYFVVWVDGNFDPNNDDYKNTLSQLRGVVNEVILCSTSEQCIKQLNENNDEIAFVISSGALGQHLVPEIHDASKLDSIYIFCGNKQQHEAWTKNWKKIKGVHTTIKPICEALQFAVKQCNQSNISLSIIGISEGGSSEDLNRLDPTFMYTQIFKEILLDMEHDQQAVNDLVTYCQNEYQGNSQEITFINEFECTYHPSKAVWWYTRECFTYKMLNAALRTLDGDIIIRMGFFLCDVHRQIDELHKKQVNVYQGMSFSVYRGQGLSISDFDKITINKGGLISFNSFLSTSKKREMSVGFAQDALKKIDTVGILFKMSIDPSISSIPFASIREVSEFVEEDEILFSMNTVFRIGEVRQINKNRSLYEVDLKLTSDDDQQLRKLMESVREEVSDSISWVRLGKLLFKLGQCDKAEELYTLLLEQTHDDADKEHIYHELGCVKQNRGENKEAISYFEKHLEINRKTLPDDHPSLATTYNNLAFVYKEIGDYSKALEFNDKAIKIREIALSPNDRNLAISYSNIGTVYDDMGDCSKALEFYEKALKIREKTLPPNHHDLATSYHNIGQLHNKEDDYLKALGFFEKSLHIKQQTLPPNHHSLALSYISIGRVHQKIGDYSKALGFYEKALKINETTLPPTHPDLATSYSWIGSVYSDMGDCSKALELYEKALKIREIALPPNHYDLATSYHSIGFINDKMGDYSKAVGFYEKALKIYEIALPPDHADLATSYHNIAGVCSDMGDYSKALSFLEKELAIQRKTLPSTHPDIKKLIDKINNIRGGP